MAELPFADPRFFEDPYPIYHELRATEPVARTDAGMWLVTRYEDVRACQHDPRLSSDLRTWPGYEPFAEQAWGGSESPIAIQHRGSLVFMDDPQHHRLRTLVSGAFRRRAVEQMREEIRATIETLLAPSRETGTVDVVQDLALPLSTIVISALLGIPEGDRVVCRERATLIGRSFGPAPAREDLPHIDDALVAANGYFAASLDDRKVHPTDDLLSLLAAVEEEGDRLTSQEVVATANLLFGAGHETTAALIGNAVHALCLHPDQAELLRAGKVQSSDALEEFLRYDAPFQLMRKITREPLELSGVSIPAGELVLAFIGAANRDPEVYADPDRLDLTRTDVRPLSFGTGPHHCIGAPLARIEATIALESLVASSDDLRLVEPGPERLPPTAVRGFARLPVTLR